MKSKSDIPLNTLDRAFELARILTHSLAEKEGKTYRNYRIFSALAGDDREGLAAFLIWRARGEAIKEWACRR